MRTPILLPIAALLLAASCSLPESTGLPIQESSFSQENLEYCLSPLLFCVKIFYMKTKKIILTTTALLGAGALAFGAAKVVQEQKRLRNREEIVELVRDFSVVI